MLHSGLDAHHIRRAAELLAAGELVGLPTETVYGLAARADDDEAVARIFQAKGRPADHPLIVHVLNAHDAAEFADRLNNVAHRLIAAFWPGPLTVIVRRARGVAAAAAGGQSTIGLRCPSHPVARELLEAARHLGVFGVAAPSANRFGRVSPTSAQHVEEEFGPDLFVLDGGECEVGIESTIVDCSREHPVLLRPGVLLRTQIEAAAGEALHEPDRAAPRAPGTLAAHYAPRARVRVLSSERLAERLAQDRPDGVAVYARTDLACLGEGEGESEGGPGEVLRQALVRRMPSEAGAAAHELFAVLRALDGAGAREIWIEAPPDTPAWEGVRDRLSRAAASGGD